jgi:hypothetical protein
LADCPPSACGARQNVEVIAHRGARRAAFAALLVPALVLTGCGGDTGTASKPTSSPSVDLPTGDVQVPSGVTLTKAGTALEFGQQAVVAFEPNTQKSSALGMTVRSVQTGRISDLNGYQLDATTKKSRPYYVRATVKNLGSGDVGGSVVPLLAVDSRNTLIQPTSFVNNGFDRCPSTPLPKPFGAKKSVQSCLVYLIPDGGRLTALSYRPLQAFEPITWKGDIAPVKTAKKAAAKKKTTKKG